MVDGPFTVYDLDRLDRAPHHVVLAACEAALPQVISIDEVLGMAAALLAQGTASLIAPVISVVDQETVSVMHGYHIELRSGKSAAAALAAVQQDAAEPGCRQLGLGGIIRLHGRRTTTRSAAAT